MKILALIAARGGSKRLPGKNIRVLGGKPLIEWSIDVAKGMPMICDILVSTDDAAIAEVAKKAGALVPWLRPEKLATDSVTSIDVAIHAVDWYESERGAVDGIMLLQPTSPFRSHETVTRGIELFQQCDRRPVVGISSTHYHPMWCVQVNGSTMKPFMAGGGLNKRSQDLPEAYVVNGAFYLVSPAYLRGNKSFYSEDMVPLIIDSDREAIDIDTEFDWKVAEALL